MDEQPEESYTLLFDIQQLRPGCVLLQALIGAHSFNPAFQLFKVETWLTAPTDNMKRITATLEQWQRMADKVNGSVK